jgi:hypothetical protein
MLNFGATVFIIWLTVCFSVNCRTETADKSEQVSEKTKSQNKMTMEENNEKKKMPILQTEINLQQENLQVKYKVKNVTEEEIYLFNVLWDWNSQGQYIPDPKPAYATMAEPGLLHIAKQIPALPKTRRVELRRIPFVTKVAPGETFEDVFTIKVPVEEYNPYFPKEQNSETELIEADSVVFSTQFVFGSDELEIKDAPLQNSYSIWHPELLNMVETLRSKESPVNVKVEKRLDPFESI